MIILAAILAVVLLAVWTVGLVARLRARRRGLALQNDRPVACVICGVEAAPYYMPIFREIPRSLAERLHQTTPMYEIVSDESQACLCLIHRRGIERYKEGRLAAIRSRCAGFNTGVEQEVATVDGGEAVLVAQQEWADQMSKIRIEHNIPVGTPLPLPSAAPKGTLTLPPPEDESSGQTEPATDPELAG